MGAAVGKPAAAPVLSPMAAGDVSGIYGNVQDSPETGDMSGYELRFFRKGDVSMVEMTLCEGWCNDTHIAPVRRDGTALVFEYDERLVDQDGRLSRPIRNRLRLVPSRGGFLVSHWTNGRPAWDGARPVRIKRQKHLYGLAVARDKMAE